MKINSREKICNLYDKYGNLLSPSQKQAIYLYYFEDLSLREIADISATSRAAIQNAIKKGTEKMKTIDAKITT